MMEDNEETKHMLTGTSAQPAEQQRRKQSWILENLESRHEVSIIDRQYL